MKKGLSQLLTPERRAKYLANKRRFYLCHKEEYMEYQRKWREEHPEEHHDQWKRHYYKYREYHCARSRKYGANNRPLRARQLRDWLKRNPLKSKLYNNKRRSLTQDLTFEIIQQVYEDNIKKYGTLTCYLCLNPIQFGQDALEHKIPLSRGGTNLYENLEIAHRSCNSKKNNKTLNEFLEAKS